MVARIRSGKSLKGAVNYNEQKVREGRAACIGAEGYAKEYHKLTLGQKMDRLQRLADLNTRAVTNCVHISLNFDPSEKLNEETLKQVAESYMQGINFSGQPYLIYRHNDAAHPHIHIVSTNIRKDGTRISLHNLGKGDSEKIRKEIEVKFGLIKAAGRQNKVDGGLAPVNIEKVQYGRAETKRAITKVVNAVVTQYKFTSLPEFNAILKQFNVVADRGKEHTRMYEKGGLQYSVTDDKGNRIGVPVKASQVYGRPVLKLLELKFEQNKAERQPFKVELKQSILNTLNSQKDKTGFENELKQKGIDVVWRINAQNFIYGVTYVDHHRKVTFNGSDLGKECSAAAIRDRWTSGSTAQQTMMNDRSGYSHHSGAKLAHNQLSPGQTSPMHSSPQQHNLPATEVQPSQGKDLLEIITEPQKQGGPTPYGLKRKRKRKRKNLR